MGKYFDPNESSLYLMYYYVNRLSSISMVVPLPTGNSEWVDSYSVDILNRTSSEHMVPPISKYKIPKLMVTLFDKKRYVIHYHFIHRFLKFKVLLDDEIYSFQQ